MKSVNPYLTFNGNCRAAMTFYQQCLGGKLVFQTVGESPLSDKMPKKMKNAILHSSLSNSHLLLLGSDMAGEDGVIKGNAVLLSLTCDSKKEATVFYEKLSAGGLATHPLTNNFWGALFGGLTDKYGNHWLLNCRK